MTVVFAKRCQRILALLISLLAIPVPGFALDAPANLVPAGLNPGDQFYLIFTTSPAYTATSTNMANYDAIVNAEAQGGSALAGLSSLTWKILGATAAVNQCKPFADLTKPVYSVTKVLVSSTASAMFLGGATNLSSQPRVTPAGTNSASAVTWTGCTNTGTAAVGQQLGAANPAIGANTTNNSFWINIGTLGQANVQSLYAVSPLLTAPSPTPVPTLSEWPQILMMISMICAVGFYGLRTRQR